MAIMVPLTPIWLPVLCAVNCFKAHRPKPTEEQLRRQRHVTSHARRPMPLPLRRKFELSNENLLPEQPLQSALLRLPFSVREQIYQFVIANCFIINPTLIPYHLASTHYPLPPWWPANSNAAYHNMSQSSREDERSLNFNLLLTCRQLYQECAPLLYSTNNFDFKSIQVVIYLAQTIRSNRLASIRFMSLNLTICSGSGIEGRLSFYPYDKPTWLWGWEIITERMTGLREVNVSLIFAGGVFDGEEEWLVPISALRGLKLFHLNVVYMSESWQDSRVSDKILALRDSIRLGALLPRALSPEEEMRMLLEQQQRDDDVKVEDAVALAIS